MVFNQLDIHLLITAICVISSALICYTIGVWGERFQGQLKAWHLWFFVLGLYADAIGTGLMEHIAQLTHLHDTVHTVTGIILIVSVSTWGCLSINRGHRSYILRNKSYIW